MIFSKITCDTNGHIVIILEEIVQEYLQNHIPFYITLVNETCMEKGIDDEDFIIKRNIHGCAGFEQYAASRLLEEYVTKCNTKGSLNSDN